MKKIFGLLVAFGLGGVVGYIVGGKTCADHYRETIKGLEEEVNEVTNRNLDLVKNAARNVVNKQKAEMVDKITEVLQQNRDKYNAIAQDYSGEADEESEEDEKFDPDDIYMITDDEFRKDLNYRDCETITYYQEDHMLVDSCDMPIHDEERTIGQEALDELPETDKDYIYVSNDYDNIMYEIVVEHNQSFYRDILGMEV